MIHRDPNTARRGAPLHRAHDDRGVSSHQQPTLSSLLGAPLHQAVPPKDDGDVLGRRLRSAERRVVIVREHGARQLLEQAAAAELRLIHIHATLADPAGNAAAMFPGAPRPQEPPSSPLSPQGRAGTLRGEIGGSVEGLRRALETQLRNVRSLDAELRHRDAMREEAIAAERAAWASERDELHTALRRYQR